MAFEIFITFPISIFLLFLYSISYIYLNFFTYSDLYHKKIIVYSLINNKLLNHLT